MGRRRSIAGRIGAAGLFSVIVGGAVIAGAVSASASSGTITLSPGPTTGYTSGESVTVGVSGLLASAQVSIYECSLATGQPTVEADGFNLPVSCTVPVAAGSTNKSGKLKTPFVTTVATGVTGPPASELDTAGHPAATDAANYPCPQFVGQSGGCAFFAFDSKGGGAGPESFTFASSVPVPTSTVPSTTTTTAPCIPQSGTASIADGATVTVSQATCLTSGTVVTVTGSGFTPGHPGGITQCSSAPGQPTVPLVGNPIPVSCSSPINALQVVSPSGTISSTFTVYEGTVGPPASGTDSAGNAASLDAEKYPCPTDVTTGVGCTIGYGDTPTEAVTVPITFVPNNPGTGGTGGSTKANGQGSGSAGTGSSTSPAKVTATSSHSLAFTGVGAGVRWMGAGGAVLVALGILMMAMARRPGLVTPHAQRETQCGND